MADATRRRPTTLRGEECPPPAYCLVLRFLHYEMDADDSEWQRALRPPTTEYTPRVLAGASQIARAVDLSQSPPPPVNDVHDRPEAMSQIYLASIVPPAYYRPTHTSPPAFKSGLQVSGISSCTGGHRRDVGAGSIKNEDRKMADEWDDDRAWLSRRWLIEMHLVEIRVQAAAEWRVYTEIS